MTTKKTLKIRVRKRKQSRLSVSESTYLTLVEPEEGYDFLTIGDSLPTDVFRWMHIPFATDNPNGFGVTELYQTCVFGKTYSEVALPYFISRYKFEDGVIASFLDNRNIKPPYAVFTPDTPLRYMLVNDKYMISLGATEHGDNYDFFLISLDRNYPANGIVQLRGNRDKYTEVIREIPEEHTYFDLEFLNDTTYKVYDKRFKYLNEGKQVLKRTNYFTRGKSMVFFENIDLIEKTFSIPFYVPHFTSNSSGATTFNNILECAGRGIPGSTWKTLKVEDKVNQVIEQIDNVYTACRSELVNNLASIGITFNSIGAYHGSFEVIQNRALSCEYHLDQTDPAVRPVWDSSNVVISYATIQSLVGRPFSLFEKYLLNVLPPLSIPIHSTNKKYEAFARSSLTLYLYFICIYNFTKGDRGDITSKAGNFILPWAMVRDYQRTKLVSQETLSYVGYHLTLPFSTISRIISEVPDDVKNSFIFTPREEIKMRKNRKDIDISKASVTKLDDQEIIDILEDLVKI